MRDFFEWLKNATKIKRWIFVIMIGMILVCYGFSKIFVSERLEIKDLLAILITFIIGFTMAIIGLVYMQRRLLEIAIENHNIDEKSKALNIKALVTHKNIYEKGPNIVVIGGGNGLNNILQGLKNYTSNITAIVTVSSYGKDTQKEVKELNLNPIDVIKQSIIALSPNSDEMAKLIDHKFIAKRFQNLSFGDIYILAMQEIYGDFANSIEKSSNILSIVGKVLPVTLDEMIICAELQDGTIVEQKEKIAEMVSSKVTKINRVYVNPSNCRVAPGVIEAIKQADAIIIGPGSLYTNVIPNLLIKNVTKTIRESKAIRMYISNIMSEPGQTDDFDVSDHINAIIEHAGENIIDFCICDTGEIVPEIIRKYNMEGASLVNIDNQSIKGKGIKIIEENISTVNGERIIHDGDETARIIMELICSDLRFKDKHTDEQFVLLNSKLKDENKKRKAIAKLGKRTKTKEKVHKDRTKKLSKFNSKYKERIKSIKESEKTRQQNIKIHKKAEKLTSEEESKEKDRFLKDIYNQELKK